MCVTFLSVSVTRSFYFEVMKVGNASFFYMRVTRNVFRDLFLVAPSTLPKSNWRLSGSERNKEGRVFWL